MSWRAALSLYLQEIRIHLCQTSAASGAARDFVFRNYKDLKMLNPRLPILIREASGAEPRLYARWGKGEEVGVSLVGLSEEGISDALHKLLTAARQAPTAATAAAKA